MGRSYPPKPPYALEVGIVGNRHWATTGQVKAASNACRTVWQTILEAMTAARDLAVEAPGIERGSLREFFSNDRPRLAILSNMAEGADRFGVEAAFECARSHPEVRLELEALLPFRPEKYPEDRGARGPAFEAAEATAHHRWCPYEDAHIAGLDGRYWQRLEEDFDSPFNQAGRHRAYKHATEVLLQNADILLAVYDPCAKAGAAGTVEIIQAALAASVPVLALLVSEGETRVALYVARESHFGVGELDWATATPITDDAWRLRLRERVRYLLAIPHLLPAEGHGKDPALEKERKERLAIAVQRLRLYFGHQPPHQTCMLDGLALFLEDVWGILLKTGDIFASHCGKTPPASSASGHKGATAQEASLRLYDAHYQHASWLSACYMRTYRGSFVLAFLLAGFAVAAAVALMAAALFAHGRPPTEIILLFGGLKVALLGLLIHIEGVGRRERHQEHAADFRHLAELLRPMQWLAKLGTLVPTVELPPHYAPLDPRQGWTNWLFRALTRGEPSVASGKRGLIELDHATAKSVVDDALPNWIDKQIGYHAGNAHRMHALENGLENLGKTLLWTVLVCAICATALELRFEKGPWHILSIVLGALAAALPAFIAALSGIVSQAEAKRLNLRSEAMAALLRDRRAKLEHLKPHPLGGDAWETAQRLRGLAGIMASETVDWRALYQMHEVKAG
jgi:hypothetical protein